MILFSKRLRLGELFEQWANENRVLVCPLSVITWLLSNGMLNEEKVIDFLERKNNETTTN